MEILRGTVNLDINDFLELKRRAGYYEKTKENLTGAFHNGLSELIKSLAIFIERSGYEGSSRVEEFDAEQIIRDIIEEDKFLSISILDGNIGELIILVKTADKEGKKIVSEKDKKFIEEYNSKEEK